MSSNNDMEVETACCGLLSQLKTEFAKEKANLSQCEDLLYQLKIRIADKLLPISGNIVNQKDLILARDVLEIGTRLAVRAEDIAAFERNMAQLKCYYYDYKSQIPESPYKYELLGLNLLFLLSLNRVAEFHTELELLPVEKIQSDVYIRHSVELEQYLMEGSYNKIYLAKKNVPAKNYHFFMDILLNTLKHEITACLEKAYGNISTMKAAKRLNVTSELSACYYDAEKNMETDKTISKAAAESSKGKAFFPAMELAEQTVFYATELEMVV
ncbi:26S proteasome non-ATPase regulatory subunit 8-like isoform X1 [Arctopsyche grandis]|uniref:26S proteasome non-ATPase regulatory subunit 8-like isoform X1 n=1 Tax=Arctopsyche grandis TaxID=121162 RepID=UPI00406D6458